jgi:hypothetical protein
MMREDDVFIDDKGKIRMKRWMRQRRIRKVILRESKVEEKVEYSPGKIVGKMVFEQGKNNVYLVYDLAERKFVLPSNPERVWDSISFEGVTYRPLDRLFWKPLPSSGFLDYPPLEELWKEIKEFIKIYVDLPEDFQYDILVAWILHTWRVENFSVSPYLFFYGPKGSGKTRTMEVLSHLCYRSIMSPSCTGASLMRLAEKYCPSLFLDEAQIYSKEEKAEVNALLNAGYKRGQQAFRTFIKQNGEEEVKAYEPFCPKSLAGTRELLETVIDRSLLFIMSRNIRPIPLQIEQEKIERLRAKLFLYRLRCLAENTGLIKVDVPEQYLTYGRIIEILYPLITVAPSDLKPRFYEYAASLEKERGIEEALSFEARVFNGLSKAHREHETFIPLQTVADFVNKNLSEKESLSNKAVGSIVSKLGFKKQYYKNRTHIVWNEAVFKRLERRYPKDAEEQEVELKPFPGTVAGEQQHRNSHSNGEE